MVPTWLHFPCQNPSKTSQKSIPRGINFLIDFWMDFLSILAPTWGPTWSHVGHFFGQNGGTRLSSSLFFVALDFFFGFFRAGPWGTPSGAVPNPMGYPSWARFLDPFGLDFQRFCGPFCKFCGSFLTSILALFTCSFSKLPCWLKGWWGYAKRKEFMF